ncbi:unnamed protein product [Closterium sp. Yama58-4]|nr:unnamed protein product [Closterium sp. Yama58-4]
MVEWRRCERADCRGASTGVKTGIMARHGGKERWAAASSDDPDSPKLTESVGQVHRDAARRGAMEEEKAAAYYQDLVRRGSNAARFKQGLGFGSSTAADASGDGGGGGAVWSKGGAGLTFVAASGGAASFERENLEPPTQKSPGGGAAPIAETFSESAEAMGETRAGGRIGEEMGGGALSGRTWRGGRSEAGVGRGLGEGGAAAGAEAGAGAAAAGAGAARAAEGRRGGEGVGAAEAEVGAGRGGGEAGVAAGAGAGRGGGVGEAGAGSGGAGVGAGRGEAGAEAGRGRAEVGGGAGAGVAVEVGRGEAEAGRGSAELRAQQLKERMEQQFHKAAAKEAASDKATGLGGEWERFGFDSTAPLEEERDADADVEDADLTAGMGSADALGGAEDHAHLDQIKSSFVFSSFSNRGTTTQQAHENAIFGAPPSAATVAAALGVEEEDDEESVPVIVGLVVDTRPAGDSTRNAAAGTLQPHAQAVQDESAGVPGGALSLVEGGASAGEVAGAGGMEDGVAWACNGQQQVCFEGCWSGMYGSMLNAGSAACR